MKLVYWSDLRQVLLDIAGQIFSYYYHHPKREKAVIDIDSQIVTDIIKLGKELENRRKGMRIYLEEEDGG